MNLYQKIASVRVALQSGGMKKSGRNNHAKYDYFELSDMSPEINRLEAEHGLCSFVSFGSDVATLTIVDAEKPEVRETVTCPMSTAKLPACHEVQNLGAVETYVRRYLYTAAYNIVECDALEATTGAPEPKGKAAPKGKPAPAPNDTPAQAATPEHIQSLYDLAASKGYNNASVARQTQKKYGRQPELLTDDQFAEMFVGYGSLPDKAAS